MLKDIELATLEKELSGLGKTAAVDDAGASRFAVRGVVPRLTCTPATPESLAAALAACDRAGAAVIPWGGGTQQRLGRPPKRADVVLMTGGLARILEYEPADLTITVETGLRLRELQSELAKHGQWLPLDPPVPADATVGGLIATNVNGPRRIKYGGVRDLVIGTRTASVDGKVTRAGGHVVKNVTGYDLNKAHIGAIGTLGVLVEASLKIAPRPGVERSWFAVFQSESGAAAAVSALLRMPSPPAALEILNHRAARTAGLSLVPGQWALFATAEGFHLQVERLLAEFESAAKANGAVSSEPLSGRTAADLWLAYRTMAADLRWTSEALTCRIACPPAGIGELCSLAGALGGEPLVWAHAYGSVFWSIPVGAGGDYANLAEQLRATARNSGAAMVVENWPSFHTGIEVWGPTGGPLSIMEAIKRQFDPNGTLNPGRFVGSI